MLFEPTYVIPDLRNGLGNGVIDATKSFSVSWKVNGQPYLAAFRIVIYENNAQSTQVFDTGKRTDNCPFYGTDPEGNPRFFSYEIEMNPGTWVFQNGKEYKLVITQWWNDTDFIKQSSASAFIARKEPEVRIGDNNPFISINSRQYTFEAAYTQEQGDTIRWARWLINKKVGTETLPGPGGTTIMRSLFEQIVDTGEINGVSDLQFTFDGFLPGQFSVELIVQTENGITARDSKSVSVSYEESSIPGVLRVSQTCPSGGVALDISAASVINGSATGEYVIENGLVRLSGQSSISWYEENGAPMAFATPWVLMWKGVLYHESDADLLEVHLGDFSKYGTLRAQYTAGDKTLRIQMEESGKELFSIDAAHSFDYDTTVTMVVVPGQKTQGKSGYQAIYQIYLRLEYVSIGLFPGDSLYPSNKQYPSADGPQVKVLHYEKSTARNYSNTICRITTGGTADVDYVQVLKGEVSEEIFADAISNGTYVPERTGFEYMLADFISGINAGNLDQSGVNATKFALYRKRPGDVLLHHVSDFPLRTRMAYDYGMGNKTGPYSYYLYAATEGNGSTSPLVGEDVDPCWWNWMILECSFFGNGTNFREKVYEVQAVYRFGKNISSGSMSNNNEPSVRPNLTRFPTVQRSNVNYQSGTLTSLIGVLDEDGNYKDTIDLRDAIYQLSTTQNFLFLKNRKGDVFPIRIAGPITMVTMDNTEEQAQNAALPWVQTGTMDNKNIISMRGL